MMETRRYAYNFAEIDNATNMCIGVITTTDPNTEGPTGGGTTFVAIPVYDENYSLKYYNWDNGKFYYDSAYTQEYISPLLQ